MVELKTSDGLKIAATYYKSNAQTRDAVILLHMLGRNRGDYSDFAARLKDSFEVIAIDFRGHGESDGNLAAFGSGDFCNFELDVGAAKEFLEKNNKKAYAIIGGSIGANTALNFATKNGIGQAVLLSPGLDYRGVGTEESARKFSGRLFLAASEDDPYSAMSVRKIYALSPAKKELKIFQNAGHGTKMFSSTDLEVQVMNWLKN
ncbi:MAG: alpha/beta hydrolase [Candidatus Micrarchaeota archaeon]